MPDLPKPAKAEREPVLNPVDRVSEMLFGLFMALTFVGAVSTAEPHDTQVHTLFVAALGCNLAWGLVDAVMYLVRTATDRAKLHTLVRQVKSEADPNAGCQLVENALPRVSSSLITATEIEAIRSRVMALPDLPERRGLNKADGLAALAIFLIVVASTFPIVLPFLMFEDVTTAKNVSRGVAVAMLFFGGLALGRYAGLGGWKVGLVMTGVGAGLVAAINALGG